MSSARTPEDCDRLFAEGMNRGDVESVVALYEPGATLVGQDGVPATGTAAIRESLRQISTMKIQFTMNVFKVVRGGDDVAALYNDWKGTFPGPDGQPAAMAGRALEIVRRHPDGTWRFVIDDPFAR